MKPKIRVTANKWNGDDAYSWAVFRSDRIEPVVTGLTRPEVAGYKRQITEAIRKENEK